MGGERRTTKVVPFLRWIGGKRRIASLLSSLVPLTINEGVYREPFAGAASLFFRLRPQCTVLGDINCDLISCYQNIKKNPTLVAKHLQAWSGTFDRERYLTARSRFNSLRKGCFEKAALFIVLNHTCFNGIWRVSRRGEFNVPFGTNVSPQLPTRTQLLEYKSTLEGVTFDTGDFEVQLRSAQSGDFIYLDPPYPALNGTAFFTHYSRGRFSPFDQERVAGEMRRLTGIGCRVLLSNAGTDSMLKLYSGFRIVHMPTTRYVAAGGIRHRVTDIAVLNYDESGALL